MRLIYLLKKLIPVFLLVLASACAEKSEENRAAETAERTREYLSPESCRPCHAAIVDSFLLTGKGRSLGPASGAENQAVWTRTSPVYDADLNLWYLPEKSGNDYFIREFRLDGTDTIHLRNEKVSHVIGSGNQTVSFLREENGYLYEMPLTWYRKKGIWDLSPGYEKGGNQRFSREIGIECMECHSSGTEPVPHSMNRYKKSGYALSCGACHGELEDHLKATAKGLKGENAAVFRIGRASPEIQMDVCRQCHLEGIKVARDKSPAGTFKPGKRFSDYFEVFIPGSGEKEFGFASHAERLQMSACFKQSKGTLTCTGCHDPHNRLPADPDNFFNAKCISCHSNGAHRKQCSVTEKKDAGCISCHLRKSGTSDIPHVNSTDHWIRKRPEKEKPSANQTGLQHFAGSRYTRRELGKAYLFLAETKGDSLNMKKVSEFLQALSAEEKLHYHYLQGSPALPGCDTGSFGTSDDPLLLFRWAEVKKRAGLPWYSTLLKACQLAPFRIDFLFRKAVYDEESGRNADYQGILALQPLHPEANTNLGYAALQAGNSALAENYLKNALKGNPDKLLARENLARCYMESGKFREARKELGILMKMNPGEPRYRQAMESLP